METTKVTNNSNKQQNDKQQFYSLLKKYWWVLLIIFLLLIIINYLIFSIFCCKCSKKHNIYYDTRKLDTTIDNVTGLTTSYFDSHVINDNPTLNVRYIDDIYNQFHFMTDTDTGIVYINKAFE